MKRRTLFFLGLGGAAGCARGTGLRLNVLNWSNYLGNDTLPRFEAETGIRVRYAVYESNEEMLARVMSGNSGWDVVFPTHYYIQPMRELNLLTRIDRARLPRLSNLASTFQSPVWDPSLEHCVPYMWGSSGIVYNAKQATGIASWSDLWDRKLAGRITMLDDPAEVYGAALKKLKMPLNSGDDDALHRAHTEALRQKPLLRAYLNAEVRDQMVAGDLAACQLWATTAQQAMDEAPHLRFVYPSEGFALYADCAAILRESKRVEAAHKFIDFLLRPEIASSIVQVSRTGTANGRAQASDLPTLYPSPEILSRGEWFGTLPARALRLRDRLWTELKSA